MRSNAFLCYRHSLLFLSRRRMTEILPPRTDSTTMLLKCSSIKRTTQQLSEQYAGNGLAQGCNRPRVMPFRANRASPEGRIAAVFRDWVSPSGRRERRGKNGSVRRPGTRKPQCKGWHDDENRANLVLRSGPVRVLV